jgi:WD40 repeat protein
MYLHAQCVWAWKNPELQVGKRRHITSTDRNYNTDCHTRPLFYPHTATKLNWHFQGIVPAIDAFVLEREDGKFFLVSDLSNYSTLSYWYSEDIQSLIDSPVIAELPTGAYVFQFLPSPDGERIVVTGINSRGLGIGTGIDSRTFSFITRIGETYQPEDPEVPGMMFYPLSWSPDGRVLVGLSHDGRKLSIWNPATGNLEILYSDDKQPRINFWSTAVSSIAVVWLN